MDLTSEKERQEEREIDELVDNCRRLHLPAPPRTYYTIESKDKDGAVVDTVRQRSKSWVRNFYNWQVTQQMTCTSDSMGTTYGAGTLAVKNTSGSTLSYANYAIRCWNLFVGGGYTASAGDVTAGIVIGTNAGATAETFESHSLDTMVAEGTGAGQMSYGSTGVVVPVWDGTGKTMTYECTRHITNNSGSTIGINEIGLIAGYLQYGTSHTTDLLVVRDVLASQVDVVHEGQITVTYTIVITYPE